MPNCLNASVLFRAYIRRKPSGLLLVTVLSAALPRPVFRMYPADIGEAAAVERSVGHAMCALQKCAPSKGQQGDNPCFKAAFPCAHEQHEGYRDNIGEHSHALLPTVNVVVAEPHTLPRLKHTAESEPESDQPDHSGCAEKKDCEVKSVFQHGSPHVLHQSCNQAAVCSCEQAGAEGYAVKGGHLAASPFKEGIAEVCCRQRNKDATEKSRLFIGCCAPPNDNSRPDNNSAQIPQPTQHLLTLRVVWQGLL